VRVAAAEALGRRGATDCAAALASRLRRDPSWIVRRAALRVLSTLGSRLSGSVLAAADDPHWRVRHALLGILLDASGSEAHRRAIRDHLAAVPGPRAAGLWNYLQYRWTGTLLRDGGGEEAPPAWPFWDPDPAVLARNLDRMSPGDRREAAAAMPELLAHADERVRSRAAGILHEWAGPDELVRVVALLGEPRGEGAEAAAGLLAAIDLDRVEETARRFLHEPAPSPAQLAWALDRAGDAFPILVEDGSLTGWARRAAEMAPVVRAALARLAGHWDGPEAVALLQRLLEDPDADVQVHALAAAASVRDVNVDRPLLERLAAAPSAALRAAVVTAADWRGHRELLPKLALDDDWEVRHRAAVTVAAAGGGDELLRRLQQDVYPLVRAAALTADRAAELVREPQRETSWHVLAAAARLAKVPFWKLEPPTPWQPPRGAQEHPVPLTLSRAAPPHARALGPEGTLVAPVGISGHYGLSAEGFTRAVEAGVNLLFWEPNYQTLTRFAARLPASDLRALHFLAGTFEADGRRVRRDAERALRVLGIERLSFFLLFWVQSWGRLAPDVHEALRHLMAEGKVAAYGLSTHSRPLALAAIDSGWDPVMVRHSAAHGGAEAEVLPRAAASGHGLITFNNTCYGRLLRPRPGLPPPSAADCYRYTLSQPGVAACLSAPATLEQLQENLDALRDPALPDDRRRELLEQGAALYQDETVFRRLVRSR
jgi:hypothetical protein